METKINSQSTENHRNYYITDNYSEITIKYANEPLNQGRLEAPHGMAVVKGSCGDTMEIHINIENQFVSDIKFETDGCGVTLACGSAVTVLSKGKTIREVLSISPSTILNHLKGLPKDHIHCSILAVTTLHKAIADYILK